jgi:hypothetical protein
MPAMRAKIGRAARAVANWSQIIMECLQAVLNKQFEEKVAQSRKEPDGNGK